MTKREKQLLNDIYNAYKKRVMADTGSGSANTAATITDIDSNNKNKYSYQ